MIYLNIPDDPAVVAAVGRIALRHGQLDYILRMTIKTLAGLSIQDGLDATARLGSRDLRERIRNWHGGGLGKVRLCYGWRRSFSGQRRPQTDAIICYTACGRMNLMVPRSSATNTATISGPSRPSQNSMLWLRPLPK